MAPTARPKKSLKKTSKMSLQDHIAQAQTHLKHGELDLALLSAEKAHVLANDPSTRLLTTNFLGQMHIEHGNPLIARNYFLTAVKLDPQGALPESVGGGPEKFMWLAQLSEEGGADSVSWYEKAAGALRGQIQEVAGKEKRTDEEEAELLEKQSALAGVLCAVAEVYMTDLSWEVDAEERCEALVTEASMTCPGSVETWQTLANVRISQERIEEAQEALRRSMDIWSSLPGGDPRVPEFAVRVSLVRLLLEVGMMDEAQWVLDRLVKDDDQSVEAWYLGGWHRFMAGEMLAEAGRVEDKVRVWKQARRRLLQCLGLYEMLQYEDERLMEHAKELLGNVNKELGEPTTDDEETDTVPDDAEDDEDEDEEMEE